MTKDRLVNLILLDKEDKSPLAVECVEHTIRRVLEHPAFRDGKRVGRNVLAKNVHAMIPRKFESTGLRKRVVVEEILDTLICAELLNSELTYDGRTKEWTRNRKSRMKTYLKRTENQWR